MPSKVWVVQKVVTYDDDDGYKSARDTIRTCPTREIATTWRDHLAAIDKANTYEVEEQVVVEELPPFSFEAEAAVGNIALISSDEGDWTRLYLYGNMAYEGVSVPPDIWLALLRQLGYSTHARVISSSLFPGVTVLRQRDKRG